MRPNKISIAQMWRIRKKNPCCFGVQMGTKLQNIVF